MGGLFVWVAVDVVGAGCLWVLDHCSRILGCGLRAVGARAWYKLFVGGGWLLMDGLFMGGLFVDWVVVSGHGGAMSCVMASRLVKSDQTSEGRVLTIVQNLNNDERQHHHCSSFGCHFTKSDVAPRNPLMLMWPAASLVMWCCHVVLVVVVVCVVGRMRVGAIDDGGGDRGCW